MTVNKDFINKDYAKMTDEELQAAHQYWAGSVEGAPGWSSAYFAAKQLKQCCEHGHARGLKMTNPYPIKVG